MRSGHAWRSKPWSLVVAAAAILMAPLLLSAQDQEPVIGWPRDIQVPTGTITIYQPQAESLEGNVLTGRAATSYTQTGDASPVFGVFWFQARVDIDRDSRTVTIQSFTLTRVRFPSATPDQEQQYITAVQTEVPKWPQTLSMDHLLASLQAAQQEQQSEAGLKNDPPAVIFADGPAALVVYDGEPALRDIPNTKLQRVVNTPYPVIYDPASKTYYLTNTTFWYSASDPMGPWTEGITPSPEVAAAIPPDAKDQAQKEAAGVVGDNRPPRIYTAKVPTELIWTDGKPSFKPLGTGDLLYVSNTDSNVFMDVRSQAYYILLSGRWYQSKSLGGPWTFVKPDDLPASFNTIPPSSEKAPVRASVPGTEESKDTLMDSQIPQTAAIQRGQGNVSVSYDGTPQFKAIDGTDLQYAVNSGSQVLKFEGRYYLCDQGVWYVGDGPSGPWTVSDNRPGDVDQIPPSNPLYNVKYVTVYDSTPDVVYVGYTPGYLGCYPYYGTVVYGTGWYYPGWIGSFYYPYPWTWGFGWAWDPWFCGWGFGPGWGWGFGWGFAAGAWWANHGGWWGPGGIEIHNNYIHVNNININNRNINNIHNLKSGQNLYNRPDNLKRNATPEQRSQARQQIQNRSQVNRNLSNDVFAGRDGNVYRKGADGWQQRGADGWNKADLSGKGLADRGGAQRPSDRPTLDRGGLDHAQGLDRDFQARQRGDARVQDFGGHGWSGGGFGGSGFSGGVGRGGLGGGGFGGGGFRGGGRR